jgi:hypothetical protein
MKWQTHMWRIGLALSALAAFAIAAGNSAKW